MYIRLIYAAYVVMSAAQGTAITPHTPRAARPIRHIRIYIILIYAAYAACPHSAADGMALGGSRFEKNIFQSTVSRSATAHTEEHDSDSAEHPPEKNHTVIARNPPRKRKKKITAIAGSPLGGLRDE